MQIAWISDTFEQKNGIATHIKSMMPLLNGRANIRLFTGRVRKNYEYPVCSLPSIPFPLLPNYDLIFPFSKKIDAEVIHTHTTYILGFYSLLLDAKKVVTTHLHPYHIWEGLFGYNQPKILQKFAWDYVIWFLDHFDIVVAQTNATKELFRKNGLKSKLKVIPNGMNIKRSIELGKDTIDFKRKYGIKKDYAMFLGRLDASKRVDWVIETASRLPDREFVIVGSGTMEKNLKMPKNVHLFGRLTEKDKISAYKNASILLMPSVVETEGLVAQEAMVYKKPVLISNNDILKEVVGKGGLACDSVEELTKNTKLLFEDNKLREELGEKAFEEVKKRDIMESVDKLIKVYDSL